MRHLKVRRAVAPYGQVDTAVRRVVEFFDAHSEGLCSLVEALGQDELLRLFDAALDASSPAEPDGTVITRALELLSDGLAAVSVSELDQMAIRGCGPADPYAALRWYGARLSDLSKRLRNSNW
jgi:hypothetical protein